MTDLKQIMDNLMLISSAMRDVNTQLTASRFDTLRLLKTQGAMNLSQLAKQRKVKMSSMSVMMDQLLKDGSVIKARSKSDKRQHVYIINRKGSTLLSEDIEQMQTRLELILSDYNHQQLAQFDDLVQSISSKLNKGIASNA